MRYVFPFLILLFSTALYLNTLDNEFVSDDIYQVAGNEWIKDISNVWRIIFSSAWSFEENGGSGYYRPLMSLSYMLSYKLSGIEPWGYHLVNIMLHSLNALMVFYLAGLLFNDISLRTTLTAFTAALLFSAHPVNTEAVAWVASFPELSYTLFGLTAFYLHIKGRTFLCALSFFIACFSKETAIIFLLLFIAYDILAGKKPLSTRLLLSYWPYALTALVYMGIRSYAVSGAGHGPAVRLVTDYEFALNTMPLVWEYMKKLVMPTDLIFYGYLRFEPLRSISEPKAIAFLAAYAATAGLLFYLRKRQPFLVFTALWILLPLAPAVYLGWTKGMPVFNERYLYQSTIPFAMLVSGLAIKAYAIAQTPIMKRISAAIAVACLLAIITVYSAGTIKRNNIWQNGFTLWKDTAQKAPHVEAARVSYGNELAKRGLYKEALNEYESAIRMSPSYPGVHNNIGIIYAKMGLLSEAVKEFKTALIINPGEKETRENLERALEILRQTKEGR